jgi:hypothetical protein
VPRFSVGALYFLAGQGEQEGASSRQGRMPLCEFLVGGWGGRSEREPDRDDVLLAVFNLMSV